MTLAPDQARPRPDLTFLRHRRRPARSNTVIAEFIASHSPRAGGSAWRPAPPRAAPIARPSTPRATPRATPPPAARPAASTSLDLGGPPAAAAAATSFDVDAPAPSSGSSTSLDLGGPPARSTSSSLDLSEPAASAAPSAGSTSLDLDGPAPTTGAATSLDLGAPSTPPAGESTSLDLGGPPPPPPGGSSSLDLGGPPPGSTSLDLGAPAPPAPSPSTGSTSLDLGGAPAAPPRPASTSSTSLDLGPAPTAAVPPARSTGADTSLDLGGPVPATPSRPAARPAASPAAGTVWVPARTDNRIPTVLQPSAPEVVLDRRQSAVGTLTIEAVVGADVGDLRLGAAYQLTSGPSSTVQHSTGRRFGPASERQRPVLLASRGPGEQLEIDLRQVRDTERVVVYAFSGNGVPLQWGGTLRIITFGGAKIEIPLDQPPSAVVTVVAAIYQVDGELVVRAERDLAGRTVKEACRAYGFDRISWLDEQTPVD